MQSRPKRKKLYGKVIAAAVILIFVLAAAYQCGLLQGFQLPANTLPSTTGSESSEQPSTSLSTSSTPPPTSSLTTSQTSIEIDASWVQQFMAAVNQNRSALGESALQYSSTVSQFSEIRFNTMVTNYAISHYGFDQDEASFYFNGIPPTDLFGNSAGGSTFVLNQTALDEVVNQGAYYNLPSDFSGSYWPIVLAPVGGGPTTTIYFTTQSAITAYIAATYGKYTAVSFSPDGTFTVTPPALGEVVFFPDGFTADGYAGQTQTTAPGHWQELTDGALSYYGFYLEQGPTISVGSSCPVTEIPGPNINITQFDLDAGCQPILGTGTWLVIDLASTP
jgi:hypothetical protein